MRGTVAPAILRREEVSRESQAICAISRPLDSQFREVFVLRRASNQGLD